MASKTRTRKPRLNRDQIATEALRNALQERSIANYRPIIEGFIEKGIPASEITPRENVFTYNAWRALGRQVRKGERGVAVVTWITSKGGKSEGKESQAEGEGEGFKFPRTVTVFHISQTDPIASPRQAEQSQPSEAAA